MAADRRWYSILYVQVLVAIAIGVGIGYFHPQAGAALKPLGDAFIQLIKMMIGPVIFCTVVHGIASMRDMAKVGRVGVKALVYFEVVSTLALAIGLIVGELAKPGAGFNIDPATLDPKAVSGYVTRAKEEGIVHHLLAIIPNTFVDAFAKGDLLQILLISVLTGFAVARMGKAGEKVASAIEIMGQVFFRIIGIIVRAAPIGALGAMAFTVGAYGIGSLINLGVLIVLGTSSSETVLPHMMLKMERAGASRSVVGLVIPMGYSFNLDGTNIYMTLASLFLAQATNTQLGLGQELTLLAIAMLTSKGASGVTGAGFVTLAATLSIVPDIPIQSLALLVGIDKFMSECRALTNLIGNGVATLVISRWERELDLPRLQEVMERPLEIDRVTA